MENFRNTDVVSPEQTEIVERVNAEYRQSRIDMVVLYVGILAALAWAVLRWIFQLWLPAATGLCIWVGALLYYAEIYRMPFAQNWLEVIKGLSADHKEIRCIVLLCMPAISRFLIILLLAILRS